MKTLPLVPEIVCYKFWKSGKILGKLQYMFAVFAKYIFKSLPLSTSQRWDTGLEIPLV